MIPAKTNINNKSSAPIKKFYGLHFFGKKNSKACMTMSAAQMKQTVFLREI